MKPRKIVNPYAHQGMPGHNCFGCSKLNPIGLHLDFVDVDGRIQCLWQPQEQFEGYTNVIHGGIQATILDEVACYVVYTQCKTAGVTINLNVNYHAPFYISEGEVVIEAVLLNVEGRNAIIEAKITSKHGKLIADAIVTYFIYPEKIAIKKFAFPGVEAFYEKEVD